jgi:uncharacterized protein
LRQVAVDTNILVYAHCSQFAEHLKARASLESLLRDSDCRVVFTVPILHEFMHIITDGRRLDHPATMDQALGIVRAYHGRTNIRILATDETDLLNALALVGKHRLGRKRLADTLLAATLRRYSVQRLHTRNRKDFKTFEFLTTKDPTL